MYEIVSFSLLKGSQSLIGYLLLYSTCQQNLLCDVNCLSCFNENTSDAVWSEELLSWVKCLIVFNFYIGRLDIALQSGKFHVCLAIA